MGNAAALAVLGHPMLKRPMVYLVFLYYHLPYTAGRDPCLCSMVEEESMLLNRANKLSAYHFPSSHFNLLC